MSQHEFGPSDDKALAHRQAAAEIQRTPARTPDEVCDLIDQALTHQEMANRIEAQRARQAAQPNLQPDMSLAEAFPGIARLGSNVVGFVKRGWGA